ncbi:MAG: hypothetical protein WCI20_08430 [bacterium]
MFFIGLSLLLLIVGLFVGSGLTVVILLAASQLALLLRFVKENTVTGLGAFTFMYFQFFAIRPIYILWEKDYKLFSSPFRLYVNPEMISSGMWWGAVALFAFVVGGFLGRRLASALFNRKRMHTDRAMPAISVQTVKRKIPVLLVVQFLTVGLGVLFRGAAKYGAAAGAYAYDLPIVFQGIHLFCALVIIDCYLQRKTLGALIPLIISVFLLLCSTYMIREFALFRGSWVTGLMIFGVGFLMHWKKRVPYIWLILPIVLLFPLFGFLGSKRTVAADQLDEVIIEQSDKIFSPLSYWTFYNSRGDMNIFDTFVAAKESSPKVQNHVWVWLYTFVHWVPRKLWPGKPAKGILQDLSFMHKAPYNPGISGLYLLDGGYAWMLFSMGLLGAIVGAADFYALFRLTGYIRVCLYAGLVVNALFLARFCMWQYFYQLLYFFLPCILLAKFLNTDKRRYSPAVSARRPAMRSRDTEEESSTTKMH